MNKPVKAGLVGVGTYLVILVGLIIIAGIEQHAGHGENNQAGWLMIALALPGAAVLSIVGPVVPTPIFSLVLLFNPALAFIVGFAVGANLTAVRRPN